MRPFRGFDSGSNPDRSTTYKQTDNFNSLINAYYKNLNLESYTEAHRKTVKRFLDRYLNFCNGDFSLNKTIEYLSMLKDNCDIAYYNKQFFQLKKFLLFLEFSWANKLPLPKQKHYEACKITNEQFDSAIKLLNNDLQMKALFLLGRSSGLRPFELYQLELQDIDIENRTIHVNRNDGKTTKNVGSIRDAFFDFETQTALKQYLNFFRSQFKYDRLFSITTVNKKLKGTGFSLKNTRHLFARNCTLKGVPSGVIKRFMGHSIKNDVLESNYTYITNQDLKRLYDKYFVDLKELQNSVNNNGNEKVI
jgi:integrase